MTKKMANEMKKVADVFNEFEEKNNIINLY